MQSSVSCCLKSGRSFFPGIPGLFLRNFSGLNCPKVHTGSRMSASCIFCKIINKEASAEIIFENEEVLVFRDIKPAAKHHFLSIPKEHLANVGCLSTEDHKDLLTKLIESGKKAVQDEGGDISDIRLGFHMPPFNSVGHLHLHVISPASEMSFFSRIVFKPNTWWFSSVDQIEKKLEISDDQQISNKL